MDKNSILTSKISIPRQVLSIIPLIFAIINLTLLSKAGDEAQFGLSTLFFIAIGSMIWDKRKSLNLETNWLACLLGAILLFFVLSQSTSVIETKHADLQRVVPFFAGIGCSLIASGFAGIKQFKSELIILFFLGIPSFIFVSLINHNIIQIAPFTAATSAFLLSYLGFTVALDGIYIYLPQGSVEVNTACAGVDLICYMLAISILAVLMFPLRKNYHIAIVTMAVGLAFLINSMRVGLMAILVDRGDQASFDYWHEGDGSLIFGMIAVVIFTLFYWLLMNKTEQAQSKKAQANKPIPIEEQNFFN